jgi:hypothetical protein
MKSKTWCVARSLASSPMSRAANRGGTNVQAKNADVEKEVSVKTGLGQGVISRLNSLILQIRTPLGIKFASVEGLPPFKRM